MYCDLLVGRLGMLWTLVHMFAVAQQFSREIIISMPFIQYSMARHKQPHNYFSRTLAALTVSALGALSGSGCANESTGRYAKPPARLPGQDIGITGPPITYVLDQHIQDYARGQLVFVARNGTASELMADSAALRDISAGLSSALYGSHSNPNVSTTDLFDTQVSYPFLEPMITIGDLDNIVTRRLYAEDEPTVQNTPSSGTVLVQTFVRGSYIIAIVAERPRDRMRAGFVLGRELEERAYGGFYEELDANAVKISGDRNDPEDVRMIDIIRP